MLSHDPETREIYESRQKAIHDQITNIQEAAKEAKKRGKIETAKKMLEDGLSIEKIKKFTDLTEQEIKDLA